ncbi:hypothetical protein J6590_099486, partial [Homalodisca vitripennis]
HHLQRDQSNRYCGLQVRGRQAAIQTISVSQIWPQGDYCTDGTGFGAFTIDIQVYSSK